jgi:3-isopropylmalate/(R)-2-methylmalate dehydratase small subunit
MEIKGNAWVYGDNINTDFILPGIYLELTDPKELAKHAMEGIDPNFTKKISIGDIVIGGRNFGLGSSREHAPLALKHSGISAIIAESFARIFYRNATNLGLPALELKDASKLIKKGSKLEVSLSEGILIINNEKKIEFTPMPSFMLEILLEGGLVPYLSKNISKW